MVHNQDQRPGDYATFASIPRPSHADYTYRCKYHVAARSGGGRASARETVACLCVCVCACVCVWCLSVCVCDYFSHFTLMGRFCQVGRVAAGAVAEKWLHMRFGIEVCAWVCAIGQEEEPITTNTLQSITRAQVEEEEVEVTDLIMLLFSS